MAWLFALFACSAPLTVPLPSDPPTEGVGGSSPSTSTGDDDDGTDDSTDSIDTGDGSTPTDTGSPPVDTGSPPVDTGGAGTTDTGSPLVYVPDDPTTLPAGLAWVRTNRPFVSGLAVNVGAPDPVEVDRYYDDFHATATHTWETGLPDEIAAWEAAGHPDFRWVSWVNADGVHPTTGLGVGDFPVTTGRIGYQIWDEPRNLVDVDAMVIGVERVRAEDPDGLVIANFGNSDGSLSEHDLWSGAIDLLAPDVVAYDYYSDGHGEYERAKLLRDLALEAGIPYWRYLDAYGSVDGRDWLPVGDARWASLLGLVYGYTGHTWFLYQTDAPTAAVVYTTLFDGTGSWGHTPTDRFWAAADMNVELEGYGESISMLTSTAVTYEPMSVLYMPDDHDPFQPGDGGDAYLQSITNVGLGPLETQEWSLGVFVDDHDEVYLMVQNANHESASFPLHRPSGTARLTFDFGGAPGNVDRTQVERFDPLTGLVESWPLTFVGGTEATVDVTLDAGNVVLLKYATGAPFARRP